MTGRESSAKDAVPGDAKRKLVDFLTSELKGSSLQVRAVSESKLVIEAEQFLAVRISSDDSKKKISYDLFSPEWKRSVRVEELDGFDFMESRAEEDLKKLDLEANAEDVILSIDLIRFWAESNKYTVEEESA